MNHEYLLRSHQWEKEDVPDRIRICHHHRKPVNPDSDTSCRRHTVFNGAQKVFINCHGFMISLCSEPCLFLKPSTLIDRVIQFRERICNLLPIANGFKAFDESLLIRVFLSDLTQFYRIVGDKSGLNYLVLDIFPENFINKLAFPRPLLIRYLQLFSYFKHLFLSLSIEVIPRLFLNRLEHGKAFPWCLEIDNVITYPDLGGPMQGQNNILYHLFHELHHPVVILIGDIELHLCKFRIVKTGESFISEILSKFINSVKSPHDQSLKV